MLKPILLAFLMTLSSPLAAQDFNKGLAAAQAGDYATAIQEWTPLADQGYARAQFNLGVMYSKGQGVPQDNVMAHMWYNIASANGQVKAGEWRDKTAGLMTPADISKAQAMARECMSSEYTKCGMAFNSLDERDTKRKQALKSEIPELPTAQAEPVDIFSVQQCWNVGSLSSLALETTVVVAVSLAQDGKPIVSSIRQIGSEGGTAASVEQAFATARRAIIRCGYRGFQLPNDKYEQWKNIEITFNPERMLIKWRIE